jgi:hypothetical protein
MGCKLMVPGDMACPRCTEAALYSPPLYSARPIPGPPHPGPAPSRARLILGPPHPRAASSSARLILGKQPRQLATSLVPA